MAKLISPPAEWDWAHRRLGKSWAIRLACGLIGSLIALMLSGSPSAPGGIDPTRTVTEIQQSLGLFDVVLDWPWISQWAAAYPHIIVAVFGFIAIGAPIALVLQMWLLDKVLVSFNDDALVPVSHPERPDREEKSSQFIELPWTLPSTGPRRQAWSELGAWASDGAFVRTGPFGRFGTPVNAFSIQVLTGRAGSGKSRMAFEFARSLARRDQLGGQKPKAPVLWQLATWVRRVVEPLRPAADDPWDAGMVKGNGHLLKGWRPRRPTILILDDPGVGTTASVLGYLQEASGEFRHPVRLLVTNQTVPEDSGLYWNAAPGHEGDERWIRDKASVVHPPVMLPPEAWFTEAETVGIAIRLAGRDSRGEAKQIEIEKGIRSQLYSITRGNPLLVQLALEWIKFRDSLEGMTAEALSTERANRILTALGVNRVPEPTLWALALSSLLGGVTSARLREVIPGIILLDRSMLALCFPTDIGAGRDTDAFPAVRPDLVADAFLESVLPLLGRNALELVTQAFRLDAPKMLRAIRRPRKHGSRLAEGLAAFGKIDEATRRALVNPVDWALALADVAVICQPGDRPLSVQEDRIAATLSAVAAVEELSTEQAMEFLPRLTSLLQIPTPERADRQLRPAHAIQVVAAAARAAEGKGGWEELRPILEALRDKASDHDGLPNPDPSAFIAVGRTLRHKPFEARAFADALWNLGHEWRGYWLSVWGALAIEDGGVDEELENLAFRSMASLIEPDAAAELTREAWRLAENVQDDQVNRRLARIARIEAYAWSLVAEGAQASRARAAADMVADIAARVPDDAAVQRELVEARRHEACAWGQVPDAQVHAAVDSANETAARFPCNAEIQIEAAVALRMEAEAVSHLLGQDAAPKLQVIADAVVKIAAAFPDDAGIQETLAWTRSTEAQQAFSSDPTGVEFSRVERAANDAADVATRFPYYVDVQLAAATARSLQAAASLVSGNYPKVREASGMVTDIAARFPDNVAIQREAIKALREETIAWSRVLNELNGENVLAAANAAAAIAERFSHDALCQMRAAWCLSQVPDGAEARRVGTFADNGATICTEHPDDFDRRYFAALARCHETYAWSMVPDGAEAGNTRAAADTLAELVAPFQDNAELQSIVAEARIYEAHAWCTVPKGKAIQNVKEVVAGLDSLAGRFPHETRIQTCRQNAHKFLADILAATVGER